MSTNYRTDCFTYENLTPIIGKPDYISLHKLKKQIKANAQSVPSTLGGGNHGLLGLVLTPAEYALVSAVPFVRELYPGALDFPNGTTAIQSKMIEDAYRKRMKNYEACERVEKAITQQIVKAVHDDWLQPLRNNITDTIQGTVPVILTYLITAHGEVTARSLNVKEDRVKQMPYDPVTDPMDNIFTEVQELADYAVAARAPYSNFQMMNLASNIIAKHRVFNDSILRWERRIRATPADNTWLNFRTYFRQEYEDLQNIGELRIAETPFNQANLVSQIVEAVTEHIQPSPTPVPTVPSITTPPYGQANNVGQGVPSLTPSPVDPMAALVQQMLLMNTNLMTSMQQPPRYSSGGRGRGRSWRGGGRGRGRTFRGGSGRGSSTRPARTYRYCWTCGWQSHDGHHCYNQAPGHQADATYDNRMGGSNVGFPPSSSA